MAIFLMILLLQFVEAQTHVAIFGFALRMFMQFPLFFFQVNSYYVFCSYERRLEISLLGIFGVLNMKEIEIFS